MKLIVDCIPGRPEYPHPSFLMSERQRAFWEYQIEVFAAKAATMPEGSPSRERLLDYIESTRANLATESEFLRDFGPAQPIVFECREVTPADRRAVEAAGPYPQAVVAAYERLRPRVVAGWEGPLPDVVEAFLQTECLIEILGPVPATPSGLAS